ncbi:hypothetical protein [Winogradskyella sp. SYSU M77433]|uniref:hypothetical protein n=1 Tax=Winogradskyella sp. SYSU M77433 TaxID=3042722 RepID=UPI0024819426|nr:hypothetical protein [Winogradskyella sp. SYSU M77433]MDH7913620.1 hypothetical protein [Winogradskyella sp. SYSU M77433]
MKTKLTLGVVLIAILISACTVEELPNEDFKLSVEDLETIEYNTMSMDSIGQGSEGSDIDPGTGGEDDPDGD